MVERKRYVYYTVCSEIDLMLTTLKRIQRTTREAIRVSRRVTTARSVHRLHGVQVALTLPGPGVMFSLRAAIGTHPLPRCR